MNQIKCSLIGPFALPDNAKLSNQDSVICDAVRYINNIVMFMNTDEFNSIHINSEVNQTISIIGPRGGGKTTTLMSICDRVKTDFSDVVVSEVFYPDRVSTAKELQLGPALINIIEKSLPNCKHEISSERLALTSSWAVKIQETFSVLSRESYSINDWNEKVAKLISETSEIASSFQEFIIEELNNADKKILVVPIDDADIAIHRAEEVIDLIRMYLSHPRIVTVFACDIEALERRIRNIRLNELPNMPEVSAKEDSPFKNFFGMNPDEYNASEVVIESQYVNALLKKVLPPALRYELKPLSTKSLLDTSLHIQGRHQPSKTINELLSDFDDKCRNSSVPPLRPILSSNPGIASSNLRTFVNQFIKLEDALGRFSDQCENDALGENDIPLKCLRSEKLNMFLTQYPQATSSSARTISKIQLELLTAFMISGEFNDIITAYEKQYGTSIDESETLHDFAERIFKRLVIQGTSDYKLVYRIGEFQFLPGAQHSLISIIGDWLVHAGMPIDDWIKEMGLRYLINESFRMVTIPKKIAEKRINQHTLSLNKIDDCIKIVKRSSDKDVNYNVGVPVDLDRLFPFFIKDMESAGVYLHYTVNKSVHERFDAAFEPFLNLDNFKDDESGYFTPGIRLCGILAVQSAIHLSCLETILLHACDPYTNSVGFEYNAQNERPWMIIECKGAILVLIEIFESNLLDIGTKLLVLSYLSDLPIKNLINIQRDDNAKEQLDTLCDILTTLFDDMQNKKIISNRRRGTFSIGKINIDVAKKYCSAFQGVFDLKSLDWIRRKKQINLLLTVLKNMVFSDSWDPYSEPPSEWIKLSNLLSPAKKK